MGISILGGKLAGLSLSVPKGDLIRPTSVRLKRKLFDSQQNWEERVFIDLCCGTGAMGLEALSRGAKKVILVEKNLKVIPVTQRNIDLTLTSNLGEVLLAQKDILQYLKRFKLEYESWDDSTCLNTYLFLDPPYHERSIYLKTMKFLLEEMKFIGELLVESDRQKGPSIEELNTEKIKSYKDFIQGTSFISLYDFSSIHKD